MLLLKCTPSFSVLFFFFSFPTLIKRFFPSPWYSADVVRRSSSTAVLFRLTAHADKQVWWEDRWRSYDSSHGNQECVFRVKKKKRKVKILPNALLYNACAKHDDVQQDTTPEKLPPLIYWSSGSCTFWSAPTKMIHSADNSVSDWFWIKLSLILCHPAAAAMAAKLWCSRTISL